MQTNNTNEQPSEQDGQKDEFHLSQLASVGQIAAGIAHEVRNPLTAVKGFLQLLNEKNPDDYIDIAQSELDNALMTLENLLQVSKPDLEGEAFYSFNLSSELESILHLFQDQLYRVGIEKKFRDTDAQIYGQKNQLKKAFFNLFKNAFEAIPDKGTVTIEHFTANDHVHITIQDTGIGIPKEQLSQVGTPFFTTKAKGTGMGLPQVFSVIYQHKGKIKIESKENEGTTFWISLPIDFAKKPRGVTPLDLVLEENASLSSFFQKNRAKFEEHLLLEAVNVRDKIEEIHRIGNIDLLNNAYKIALYVVEERRHELMLFAREEGVVWAQHSLTIAFKLEWLQAIRRVMWDFLYNYDRLRGENGNRDEFYTLEKHINELVDQFFSHFFISYTTHKDKEIQSQRELIENLSVPIIPLTNTISILPLVGTIDSYRINTITEKVLQQISLYKIDTLIIDLSGVAMMDADILEQLLHILDGINMMGCRPIITGIRAEVAQAMTDAGISFRQRADIKGTLQQAIETYFMMKVE